MTTIFLDANVFIYATGRPHPLKQPSGEVLLLAASHPEQFLTSAEVIQELIHRFMALHAWSTGRQTVSDALTLMGGRIEPLLAEDVALACDLVGHNPGLSARDLTHLAVMSRTGCTRIASADSSFDRVSEIQRLDPLLVDGWRGAPAG